MGSIVISLSHSQTRELEQPSTPLFTVPPSALVNVRTLAPLYPSSENLSAHQLISLHLYLYKPPDATKESADNVFGPFISILPREFDSHPLTWIIRKTMDEDSKLESIFLGLLPRSTQSALNALEKRFQWDSNAVISYLVGPTWVR